MSFFKSKKFWATVTAIAVAIGSNYLGLDESTVTNVVQVISVYVIGQGVADAGKEKARIERNISK